MAGVTFMGRAIRVTAKQPSRRRAGFGFTSEPRELAGEELGEGLAALFRLIMICEDPELDVALVTKTDDGEDVLKVGAAEIAEMRAVFDAEQARVDLSNPPVLISELTTPGGSKPEAEGAAALTGDGGETVPAPVAEPDTAPADATKPAGEEIASPAAEATGSTKPKRGKA